MRREREKGRKGKRLGGKKFIECMYGEKESKKDREMEGKQIEKIKKYQKKRERERETLIAEHASTPSW